MKLPEFEKFKEPGSMDGISRFELAQLHCLRSIAVSLEVIAVTMTGDSTAIRDEAANGNVEHAIEAMNCLIAIVGAHSVKEAPGD